MKSSPSPVAHPGLAQRRESLSENRPGAQATLIRPSGGILRLRLRELWDYRELLYFLAWRDVKVRYKQTAFGAAWAVGQPVLMMVIFSVFLGRLVRVPSDGVPYPVFAFAGLLPWMLFAQVLQGASESLVRSSDLITKIYFPRLFLPIGVALSYVMDYAISLVILGALMFLFHVPISANVVWLPFLSVMAVATALAVGIWLSALNVRFRDVRHTVPFLVQVWLFVTPVVYPATLIPDRWRVLYALNPMVGVVEGIRWSAVGVGSAPGVLMAVSGFATLVILLGGLAFFQKVERTFADVI